MCEKQIPLQNVAGMSCDHAQVMIGNKSSFKTKLKERNPNVVVIPCVCHSVATAAKYSRAKIPDVENIIKSIPSFLTASSKRTAVCRNIVEELEVVLRKIPSHAETRWLVRHQCIVLILNNWDNILRFLMVLESEKIEKARDLLNFMQNPLTIAYSFFLKYTLNIFNIYNAKFQNREIMIQELQPQSANFLYWILGRYLKKGLLELNLFF